MTHVVILGRMEKVPSLKLLTTQTIVKSKPEVFQNDYFLLQISKEYFHKITFSENSLSFLKLCKSEPIKSLAGKKVMVCVISPFSPLSNRENIFINGAVLDGFTNLNFIIGKYEDEESFKQNVNESLINQVKYFKSKRGQEPEEIFIFYDNTHSEKYYKSISSLELNTSFGQEDYFPKIILVHTIAWVDGVFEKPQCNFALMNEDLFFILDSFTTYEIDCKNGDFNVDNIKAMCVELAQLQKEQYFGQNPFLYEEVEKIKFTLDVEKDAEKYKGLIKDI